MMNGYEQQAGTYADRFDDGSENAGTLAIVSAILAVAEELRRSREAQGTDELRELVDRLHDLAADQSRRIADLELAMRALAPSVDPKPGETRDRIAALEGMAQANADALATVSGNLADRITTLEGSRR